MSNIERPEDLLGGLFGFLEEPGRTLFMNGANLTREIPLLAPSEDVFLHYSSLEAFYAIMDTGRLRFTSAMSTNDPSEYFFGRDVLHQTMGDIPAGYNNIQRKILRSASKLIAERRFRAFVFCMSEAIGEEVEFGELSQWRLYGSDGRGIALVIDTSQNNSKSLLEEFGSIPRKVIYGQEEGRDLILNEMNTWFEKLDNDPDLRQHAAQNADDCADYLNNALFWLPSVIKHKSYIHEREVRLIRGDIGEAAGNPLVFYERGNIRRPAIERPVSHLVETDAVPQHQSPIKAVIIGPSGDQSAIYDSISYFLEARKWSLDVRRSNIPYRAMT